MREYVFSRGGWAPAKNPKFKNSVKTLAKQKKLCYNTFRYGGIAQLARVLGSYPIGHWFESSCRYHVRPKTNYFVLGFLFVGKLEATAALPLCARHFGSVVLACYGGCITHGNWEWRTCYNPAPVIVPSLLLPILYACNILSYMLYL